MKKLNTSFHHSPRWSGPLHHLRQAGKLALAGIVLGLGAPALAAPSAYEAYSYSQGTLANGAAVTGVGFTGNWTLGGTVTIVNGLAYPSLTTSGNAFQQSNNGVRSSANFANSYSSGTAYFSYLFKNTGDSGGNWVGAFLRGSGTTSLFVGFRGGYSAAQTAFGLGSVATASTPATGGTALGSTKPVYNTQTNFIVVKVDFDTAGANDTVSVWINPPAGVSAPGRAADLTYSTYDVGTITGFGLNLQGGTANVVVDEVRAGLTYGDVVTDNSVVAVGTNVTAVAIMPLVGKKISWPAYSTNDYQVQESSDNATWTVLGSTISNGATNTIYDTTLSAYYRVLEITFGGPGPNDLVNGGFETPGASDAGVEAWQSPANSTYQIVTVTNAYNTLMPHGGSSMLYMEGATAAVAPAAPNAYLLSDHFAVTPGLQYAVNFYAAHPVKVGGANPQYRVRFYNAAHAFVSEQWLSFASAGSTWTAFSSTHTAPATAAYMELYFIQAVGAGPSWDWVTLLDDVVVNALTTYGPQNILTPTVQSGVSFAASVRTNELLAMDASGTIAFSVNSTGLSTNGIASGTATSSSVLLLPPYTVTAVYSGNTLYAPSTNTLTVGTTQVEVALSNLAHTYDGTPKTVSASTIPAGFPVLVTYDGASTAPANAGSYQVIGTVVDNDYSGSVTNTLVIAKAAAEVTLENLTQAFDGAPKPVTVTTTPASLAVTVTYGGSETVPSAPGTYAVVATIADPNYTGSANSTLTITGSPSPFGTEPGTLSFAGGKATVGLSGVEGSTYVVQRATDLSFTTGLKNFDPVIAPAGGQVSVVDDFSDLGAAPETAFYRLQFVP